MMLMMVRLLVVLKVTVMVVGEWLEAGAVVTGLLVVLMMMITVMEVEVWLEVGSIVEKLLTKSTISATPVMVVGLMGLSVALPSPKTSPTHQRGVTVVGRVAVPTLWVA